MKFFTWWRVRSRREQALLMAGAVIFVLVLAWLLLIRPLDDGLARAREGHADAVISLARVRAQASELGSTPANASAPLPVAVDAMLSSATAEAGFPVTRIDRQSAREATLVIESVRPQAFFAWTDRMESAGAVAVSSLSATTNTDQTLAVQVTFKAKGR